MPNATIQTSPTMPELSAKFAEIYTFAQQHGIQKSNPKLCDDLQMIRGHFLKTESILQRVRSKWKTGECDDDINSLSTHATTKPCA